MLQHFQRIELVSLDRKNVFRSGWKNSTVQIVIYIEDILGIDLAILKGILKHPVHL